MDYLEQVSKHRIAPPAVTGLDTAADLIDRAFLSYNAGRLREVCQVFTRKMLEPNCTVGLTISGALTPAGLGMSALIPLVQAGFASTGSSPPGPTSTTTPTTPWIFLHQSHPGLDDFALRSNDIIPHLRHRLHLQDPPRYRRLLPRAGSKTTSLPVRWERPSSTTWSASIFHALAECARRHSGNSLLAAARRGGAF